MNKNAIKKFANKRTPFTLKKGPFYTSKGLLLHPKRTPFAMQKDPF